MSESDNKVDAALAKVIENLKDLDNQERERIVRTVRAFYNLAPAEAPGRRPMPLAGPVR